MPTKTDNSCLGDKLTIRINHLPDGDLRVLDCFGGEGTIWERIEKVTGRNIDCLPIDLKDNGRFRLPGDNLRFLKSLDLSKFNVIDLDAYGVPYKQLKTVFQSGYAGAVFVTFIQSYVGELPHEMLIDIGFTQSMINKCRTLLFKHGFDKFCQWLALQGVTKITHISPTPYKHYIFLDISRSM